MIASTTRSTLPLARKCDSADPVDVSTRALSSDARQDDAVWNPPQAHRHQAGEADYAALSAISQPEGMNETGR